MKLKSQIANFITLFRVTLVPFFILTIFGKSAISGFLSLILFMVGALSDYLDGLFSRKMNISSKLGVFLDPLADKVLVCAAYLSFSFVDDLYIPIGIVIVILFREFFVTLLRIIALKRGISFKTEYLGKVKTAFQMIAIGTILVLLLFKKIPLTYEGDLKILIDLSWNLPRAFLYFLPLTLVSISACIAIASMVQYMAINWKLIGLMKLK